MSESTLGSGESEEVVHLIDKSSMDVFDLVTVGFGLSLLLYGFLSVVEVIADCSSVLCLPAQNKTMTVFVTVWLPIIVFCVLRNYKVDSIPRYFLYFHTMMILNVYYYLILFIFRRVFDFGQEVDTRNALTMVQFIDENGSDYYDYLQW